MPSFRGKINEPFSLENGSILTHNPFMKSLTRKKNTRINFDDVFSRRN